MRDSWVGTHLEDILTELGMHVLWRREANSTPKSLLRLPIPLEKRAPGLHMPIRFGYQRLCLSVDSCARVMGTALAEPDSR